MEQPPPSLMMACDDFMVYSLNYYNVCVDITPVVGMDRSEIECTDCACALDSIPMIFGDNMAPVFVNPPQSGTFACIFETTPFGPLNYTDNCLPAGSVPGTEEGSSNPCESGTLTRHWEVTDECGNIGSHTQTITVNAVPVAQFINPPANITISCSDNLPVNNNLNYSNGGSGLCLISGSIAPVITNDFTSCEGGTVTYVWTFIDGCDREISHPRVITINPSVAPTFTNPPADITVDCNSIPSTIPDQTISNGQSGSCLISSTVSGVIAGDAPDVCGGEFYFSWSYTDLCGRTIVDSQRVTVTPIPQGNYISPPADITVECNAIPDQGTPLTFSNGLSGPCQIQSVITPTTVGTGDQCGGVKKFAWTYTDLCGRTKVDTQVVTINPIPEAHFVNPPANITVSCDNIPTSTVNLTVTNNDTNCPINASVVPTVTGSANNCGGIITYHWQYTDVCSRIINHSQNVTVTQMPQAQFVNPPGDMTVNCNQVPTSAPALTLTNNGTGNCSINQSITPVQSGTGSACGGTITFTWSYTDVCNRTTTHIQNITINPILTPSFVNPPANITVTCDMVPTSGVTLSVTNNDTNCPINATVTPVATGSATICGGTITYTWTYTDQCMHTINHTQTVTVTPMPQAQFINPPANITVSCDNIPTSAPLLTVKNNGPPGCNIDQQVAPTQSGTATICGGTITYTWAFTDQCMNTINHAQTVTVTPMPQAQFVNPPADITVNCDNIPSSGPILTVKNNGPTGCNIDQQVTPTQSGNATVCGGTITYTWNFTDQCLRNTTITQTVTVTPMLAPVFVNPPANITVSCENIPVSGVNLNVINNGPVGCRIDTTIAPILEGNPNVCGGNYNYRWSYTDICGRNIMNVQTITVLPAPQGQFINPPSNGTVTCDQVPPLSSFPNLVITNNIAGQCGINATVSPIVGPYPGPCGGPITATWTYTDMCNRTTSNIQTITVLPAPQASFLNVPPNITVSCDNLDNNAVIVDYSNGQAGSCLIQGMVSNSRSGNVNYCGGIFTDIWSLTDPCGRTISASRQITVLPAPAAVFTSFPSNITINCEDVVNLDVPLTYTNNLSGLCAINGQVDPIISGSYNFCGGQLFVSWAFTDLCNPPISHTQVVTVEPAPDPDFVDPPADQDLDCGGENNPPQTIDVSNGLTGPCGINMDAVLVSVVQNGGTFTNRWEYVHPCTNQLFSHTQTTTTIIAPNLVVDDPEIEICAGDVFDLSSIVVTDLNNSNPIITYHSTVPADASNEILPEIYPNPGDVYFIRGLNSEGCDDIVNIYFDIPEAPNAGGNGSANVCNDGTLLNLNTLLNGGADLGGSWLQINGNNINLSNPSSVNFDNVSAGNYTLAYVVESLFNCPSDSSFFTIIVNQEVDLNLKAISCIPGGTYQIKVTSNAPTVASNFGNVQKLTLDTFLISNIPQGQAVVLTASSSNNVCLKTISIAAPDCACPFIPEPVGTTNYSACEGSNVTIVMSVTVPAGMQANWYNSASGGQLLTSASLNYTHNQGLPGIYKYFVETFDPATGCYSLTRLEISVEINPKPTVTAYTYALCDLLDDNVEVFELNSVHGNLTSLANAISFHLTQADANNGVNALPNPYTNASSPQLIYARVVNGAGCISTGILTLELNPLPRLQLNVGDESCSGANDGSVIVTDSNNSNINTYSIDNQNWVSNNSFTNLEPGNFVVYAENQLGCKANKPFTVDPGLIVIISYFQAECDNKNTLSDPNDDIYHLKLYVVNNLNLAGSYNLSGTNGYNTNHAYADTIYLDLAANGSTVQFTVTDLLRNCSVQRSVGPLTSCSTTCTMALNILSYTCDDNGSPANPSDDIYNVVFNANAVNGSPTNNFILFVNNVLKGSYAYGVNNNVVLPANNIITNMRVQDIEDLQCSTNKDIGPLTSCSDQCILNAIIESVNCFNPGNSPGLEDDYYEINIKANLINGGNSTTFNVITENGTSFNGSYANTLKITLPADNQKHTLTISDVLNSACTTTLALDTLTPCSGPCEVDIDILSANCNNNGTSNNSNDDTYEITLDVKLINGGNSTSYQLTYDNMSLNGEYGKQIKITLPADNKAHTFNVVDIISDECKGTINTDILVPCSMPCSINATLVSSVCDDGGTTSDITDDTYKISIIASVVNGGGANSYTAKVDNQSLTGFYNQVLVISFPADGLVHIINLEDKNNVACKSQISTPALSPCSGPCEINALVSNIECSNYGTNNTDEDDEYTFDLLVTGNNTNWKIDKTGTTGTTGTILKMGPFKIKGATPDFEVYFTNSPNCKKQFNVNTPATCSECLQSVDAGKGGELSCTQNIVSLIGTSNFPGIFSWILEGQVVTNSKALNAGQPGIYYFKGNFPDGCEAIDSVEVTVDANLPLVTVSRGLKITCLVNEVTLSATATGNNLAYEWTDENGIVIGTNLSILVAKEGKYYFRAYNTLTGCSSARVVSEVIKDIEEPSSIIYAKPTVVFDCVIKTITLFNDGEPDVSYSWKANGDLVSNNKTLEITSTGDYTLIAIDTISGCSSESDLIINSLIEYPIINLSVEDTLDCLTSSVFLSSKGSQVGPDISYEWQNAAKKTISTQTGGISVNDPGKYYLILKDASNGCINEDTAEVEIFENEIDINLPVTIFVKEGDTIRLNTILNIPASQIKRIRWTPTNNLSCTDCLNPMVIVAEDISYMIEVEDIYGCKGIAEVRLLATKPDIVTVPNIFDTQSGNNNGFTVYGNDQLKLINYLKIFDRWGNLIFIKYNFQPNLPSLGWDGKLNGKAVVPGVFVYVFEVEVNGLGNKIYSGDVTVIR